MPNNGGSSGETFELVEFSNYVVGKRAPYLEETRPTVGEPTWKGLYRLAIEALIGREVERTGGVEQEGVP